MVSFSRFILSKQWLLFFSYSICGYKASAFGSRAILEGDDRNVSWCAIASVVLGFVFEMNRKLVARSVHFERNQLFLLVLVLDIISANWLDISGFISSKDNKKDGWMDAGVRGKKKVGCCFFFFFFFSFSFFG